VSVFVRSKSIAVLNYGDGDVLVILGIQSGRVLDHGGSSGVTA
jgi:hypothetical protein